MTATTTKLSDVVTVPTHAPVAPLTGDDLLAVYTQNKGTALRELCVLTGYTTTNKAGKTLHNEGGLKKAMLEAMGINIGGGAPSKGPGGRTLSYKARVQGNGNLLVGNAYCKLMGLEPGTEFQIKISQSSGTIRLVPVGSEDDEA